jgi:hypothetical protein
MGEQESAVAEPNDEAQANDLSSRPEQSEVEGPAVSQPNHENNHTNQARAGEDPSVLSVSSAVKSDLHSDEEEERLKKLADEAREIFKQLGHPYEEPSTSPGDGQEQHAQFPRTILQKQNQQGSPGFAQESLCNIASTAPPCPSSSSPSIPTIP